MIRTVLSQVDEPARQRVVAMHHVGLAINPLRG